MALPVHQYLFHFFQRLRTFLCELLRLSPKNESTTELPISSSAKNEESVDVHPPSQGVPTNEIPQPLGPTSKQHVVVVMVWLTIEPMASASWEIDKERFLRRTSLVRATLFHNAKAHAQDVETRRRRQARKVARLRPEEVCIKDWSSLGFQMSELFVSTSHANSVHDTVTIASVTEALSPSSCSSAAPSPTLSPALTIGPVTPNCHSPDIPDITIASQGDDAPNHFAQDLEAAFGDNIDIATSRILQSQDEDCHPEPTVKTTFSAPCYTPSTLSAVSGFLWDAPSPSNVTLRSIPLPQFAGTPAKPGACAFENHIDPPAANIGLNLVPYPDIFDLAMYDQRASCESDCDIIILIPKANCTEEPTVGAGVDITMTEPFGMNHDAARDRDRYRNAAYSCLSGTHMFKPKSTPAVTPPLHIVKNSPPDRKVELRSAVSPLLSPTITFSPVDDNKDLDNIIDSGVGKSRDSNMVSLENINVETLARMC